MGAVNSNRRYSYRPVVRKDRKLKRGRTKFKHCGWVFFFLKTVSACRDGSSCQGIHECSYVIIRKKLLPEWRIKDANHVTKWLYRLIGRTSSQKHRTINGRAADGGGNDEKAESQADAYQGISQQKEGSRSLGSLVSQFGAARVPAGGGWRPTLLRLADHDRRRHDLTL